VSASTAAVRGLLCAAIRAGAVQCIARHRRLI
jgi:hypothetical protein